MTACNFGLLRIATGARDRALDHAHHLSLLGAALCVTGCLHLGGEARTTFDLKTGAPIVTAQGILGGFGLQGMKDEVLQRTDKRSGFHFALAMGASYDWRIRSFRAAAGPRVGWWWPHGLTEFGFETRFGGRDAPQTWAFTITVGPRLEVHRSDQQYTRSATLLSLPAAVGFSVGDGFRPEAGIGFGASYLSWSKFERFPEE